MKLAWAKEAEDDVQRLFDFLIEKNASAAAKAMELILEGSEMLREFPKVGYLMKDESGRRELILPFGASAYVLRYYALSDTVFIVRVWHSRERR